MVFWNSRIEFSFLGEIHPFSVKVLFTENSGKQKWRNFSRILQLILELERLEEEHQGAEIYETFLGKITLIFSSLVVALPIRNLVASWFKQLKWKKRDIELSFHAE